MTTTSILTGIGGCILVSGLIDDLLTKKFHNWLFLTTFAIGAVASLSILGIHHLPIMSLSIVAAIGVFLPLVLTKAMGAGDLKILIAFATTATWLSVVEVAVFSAFWGLLFGVIKIALERNLTQFGKNLWLMALGVKGESLTLHRIPFAAAIFLGWLSHLVFAKELL